MKEYAIPRSDFQAAIDAGCLAARDEMDPDAYISIRAMGQTLTEAGVGSFTYDCPISCYEREHGYKTVPGWLSFVRAYDQAVYSTLGVVPFKGKVVVQ